MVIELGDKVRDTITGYSGICVAITKWLHGCKRIGIQPTELDKDGKPKPVEIFDEPQVEVIKAKVQPTTGRTGGPLDRRVLSKH